MPVSRLHRLAQLLVAATMVALPVLYLGVPALAAWLVTWHIQRHKTWLDVGVNAAATGGGGVLFMLAVWAVYLAPVVFGVTVVVFLLKPVLAQQPEQAEERIERSDAPLLFDLIERVAACLGTRVPRAVFVDAGTNASAGFHRGLRGLVTGQLRLSIGLPLVVMLDARQLAAVIGHEFGHFAQTGSMRLTVLVSRINGWFHRVMYTRDSWDDTIDAWGEKGGYYLELILLAARAGLWVSRRILWVFMQAGQRTISILSWHVELDADRYAARLVGSRVAVETMNAISVAEVAMNLARQYAMDQDTSLPDDLFALAAAFDVDSRSRHEIIAERASVPSRWFDMHPSHADRFACIHTDGADGVLSIEGPAARLIPALESVSKSVTALVYRAAGADLEKHRLVPTRDIAAGFDRQRDRSAAVDRFLFGLKDKWRNIRLPDGDDAVTPGEAASVAAESAALLESWRARIAALLEESEVVWYARFEAKLAAALLAIGVQPRPASPWRGACSPDEPRASYEEAEHRHDAIVEEMRPFERLVSRRLAACLALQANPAVAAAMAEVENVADRTERLSATLKALASARQVLIGLSWNDTLVRSLMAAPISEDDTALHDRVYSEASRLRIDIKRELDELRAVLADTPWPFDGAPTFGRLFQALVPDVPSGIDAGDLLNASGTALAVARNVYMSAISELTEIAMQRLEAAGPPAAAAPTAAPR